jgi:hypothetical protein
MLSQILTRFVHPAFRYIRKSVLDDHDETIENPQPASAEAAILSEVLSYEPRFRETDIQ